MHAPFHLNAGIAAFAGLIKPAVGAKGAADEFANTVFPACPQG